MNESSTSFISQLPNEIWERGIRTIFTTVLLTAFWGVTALAQPTPEEQEGPVLTQADINLFFDSVSLENGTIRFKLSEETSGMSWRIMTANGKSVTGICHGKQQLKLPSGSRLDINGKGFSLTIFQIEGDHVHVCLAEPLKGGGPKETELLMGDLIFYNDRHYIVTYIPLPI